MSAADSVFFDFNLPNATTWFYFSGLLAVALFFKFSRLLSVRNWDVVSLFLLVPGMLLLLESRMRADEPNWFGYLWLLCGSGYFLVRCLWDLALVRRPALAPNLNLAGLAWLAGALFISMVAVAFRQPHDSFDIKARAPALIEKVQDRGEKVIQQQAATDGVEGTIRSWVERGSAILCHLAIVAGLVFIGYRHFQDVQAGMAAATFYLLLPYVYLLLPDGSLHLGKWHHVWPMALIVWTVAAYRLPTLAGLLLGLAAGTVYFPVLVVPVWLSFYRGRGQGRFAGAFVLAAGVCLALIGGALLLNGELPASLRSVFSLPDWQPWKELHTNGSEGFWTRVPWAWAYRMPVFIAYVALVLATAFWPSPKNLAHVIALTAALLIGTQFWYANQGGVYVVWYLPLLLLLVFRPNLSDRQPLPIQPENDWLARLGRALGRIFVRLLKTPEPMARMR